MGFEQAQGRRRPMLEVDVGLSGWVGPMGGCQQN